MSSLEDTAQRHAEHVVEKFSSFSVNVNFPKNENKFCNYKLYNFKFLLSVIAKQTTCLLSPMI